MDECEGCHRPTDDSPCAEHQPDAYAAMWAEPVQPPWRQLHPVPLTGALRLATTVVRRRR